MHKQNEKFKRELEILKKNQTEILELKNTMSEIKYAKENINSRLNLFKKERIHEIEDRSYKWSRQSVTMSSPDSWTAVP